MISSRFAVGAALVLAGAGYASAQVIERDFGAEPNFTFAPGAGAAFVGDDFVTDFGGAPAAYITSLTVWVVDTGVFSASNYTLYLGGDLTVGGVTASSSAGVGAAAPATGSTSAYSLTFSLNWLLADFSYAAFALSGPGLLLGDEVDDGVVWSFDGAGAVFGANNEPSDVNFRATFHAVPEPSTYAAFGAAGLIGLVAFRRLRRAKHA